MSRPIVWRDAPIGEATLAAWAEDDQGGVFSENVSSSFGKTSIIFVRLTSHSSRNVHMLQRNKR
ncbi:hypothetical protein ABNQ38_10135 [Azospirillum sp. A29]|uniref:hypothetical protein n=1 Tax=Azospirillum sp. A29 TaxID=3160606 RepID=UPI00366DB7A5